MVVLAVVFAAVSLRDVEAAGPTPADHGQARALRVRHRPGREPPERFPVRFYLVAMIFIVFDIEIIFLYPWAVIYREPRRVRPRSRSCCSPSPCSCRFVYLIGNGALDWGPLKQARRQSPMVSRRAHDRAPRSAGSVSRAAERRRARAGEEVHA